MKTVLQCPKCGRAAERIQNIAIAICRSCDGVLRIEDAEVVWAGVRPSEIEPYARSLGIMIESSYTGLVGSREERLNWIRGMANEELLRSYTQSCRSGEIEIHLAGENDFNQHALKTELESRLMAIGFLPSNSRGSER